MMTKSSDRGLAHFQVFTHGVVFGNIGLGFVAHSLVDGALSGNCGLPRCFRASPCLLNLPPVLGSKPAHLCGALTLTKLVTRSFFQFGNISRLLASVSLAFGAQFAFRQMHATTAAGARQLPALTVR